MADIGLSLSFGAVAGVGVATEFGEVARASIKSGSFGLRLICTLKF